MAARSIYPPLPVYSRVLPRSSGRLHRCKHLLLGEGAAVQGDREYNTQENILML